MKLTKTLLTLLLASGLAMGLTSCKKDDKDSTPSIEAEVTITVMQDDGMGNLTPIKDAIIMSIFSDAGYGINTLAKIEEDDRTTDADGKVTFTKLLPGNYQVFIDTDGNPGSEIDDYMQIFSGANEVTFKQ